MDTSYLHFNLIAIDKPSLDALYKNLSIVYAVYLSLQATFSLSPDFPLSSSFYPLFLAKFDVLELDHLI